MRFQKQRDDLIAHRSCPNNACGNVRRFAGGTSSEVLKIVTENKFNIKINNGKTLKASTHLSCFLRLGCFNTEFCVKKKRRKT